MELLEITADNIGTEHICCAIGANADARQCAETKKAWMKAAFAEGYRFVRLNAQGKALIETVPAENAWAPIDAEGWLFIDCFWVSGKFKGQGVATRLLAEAEARARAEGRKGLVALSAEKKRPFLSDPGFYRHKGFVVADETAPWFVLYSLPFNDETPLPKFRKNSNKIELNPDGVTVLYSNHCPHTEKSAAFLGTVAAREGVPFTAKKLAGKQEAQNAPSPFTTWSMFYKGEFVTNEIFSEQKFLRFLEGV